MYNLTNNNLDGVYYVPLRFLKHNGINMTTRTILNLEKNDNNPLFLGQPLGLQEFTNPRYPELDELALLQRSQFWTETEIDMSGDAIQWKTLSPEIQDISVLNLAWQTMADSTVGRAPFTIIMPMITNPEFEGLMTQWGSFEQLHSRAYSNIFRTVFPDPQAKIDEVKKNVEAFQRMELIVELFDKVHIQSLHWQLGEPVSDAFKKDIYLMMIAIYALESMQFYCSFACTFALAEQDVLQGIADNLKLIAKDEALHTRFSLAILKALEKDPEWKSTIASTKEEAVLLMEHVIEKEKEWANYIFSEGRQIIGLNSGLMNEYLDYIAGNAFKTVGMKPSFKIIKHNPLPWINKYLDPKLVQVAPQEKQITNYRVGSSDNSFGTISKKEYSF